MNTTAILSDGFYSVLEKEIFEAASLRREARCFTLGKSRARRSIYGLVIGSGEKCSLFVGAHHGLEYITSAILMRFGRELIDSHAKNKCFCGYDTEELLGSRSIYIIPCLNPDGVELHLRGSRSLSSESGLLSRLEKMSGGDYSLWQANAAGVDLNHNYNADFELCKRLERNGGIFSPGSSRYGGEAPESEPETSALCALVRSLVPNLRIAASLHSQGEEIYWSYKGKEPPVSYVLARYFSRCTGYALSTPPESASCGGFKDWLIDKYRLPAFTLECGRGKNPLPFESVCEIYARIRPVLLACAIY